MAVSMTEFGLKYFSEYKKCVMITLTSSKNIEDGGVFSRELNYFIVNLKRYLGSDLEYVCVRERQKRGAFHYHIVVFNYQYIPFFIVERFWRLGFVWLTVGSVEKGVSYVLKYIRKGKGRSAVERSGRIHSSYKFLRRFKEEFKKFKGWFRRSYFLGRFLDRVLKLGCNVEIKKVIEQFDEMYKGREVLGL